MADRVRGIAQDTPIPANAATSLSPSAIVKGSKVAVFRDPITKVNMEGRAVVIKVLRHEPWTDAEGNPIVRCNVRFDGGEGVHQRDVSSLSDG
jgi:hypothetical protein